MARLPWMISLMRRGGTLRPLARRYCERPRGRRKSWRRISPGWTGDRRLGGMRHSSVIIHDFDIERIGEFPAEADAPLAVDANAVLAGAIGLELFQLIAGRGTEVVEPHGGIELAQLPQSDSLDVGGELADRLAKEQSFGIPVADVALEGMEGEGCGVGDLGGGEALFEQGADAVAARVGAEGDVGRAGGE